MVYPNPLEKGDKIAIISPASAIRSEYVDAACRIIKHWGFVPVVGKHCKGSCGTYSGTLEERLADIEEAMDDRDVRAILCSRGGYGTVHLLDRIVSLILSYSPRWIIGFSDISALHATMVSLGITSLHAPMAKQFATRGQRDECLQIMRRILTGELPTYTEPANALNRIGEAEGELVGGNMAVLCGLIGTDANILKPDRILFIEDIGEAVYRIERMLYTLRLNGTLANLRGLIVGQFTEYDKPDRNGETMEQMISRMVAPYGYPVAFGFPIGHVDRNLPMIEGATVRLSVTAQSTTLEFLH